MTMKKTTDILREVIVRSGQSQQGIERACGVNRACVRRFLRGEQIQTENFDRLCQHFSMTLVPVKPGKAKQKG